jgi:hypothetical protein
MMASPVRREAVRMDLAAASRLDAAMRGREAELLAVPSYEQLIIESIKACVSHCEPSFQEADPITKLVIVLGRRFIIRCI